MTGLGVRGPSPLARRLLVVAAGIVVVALSVTGYVVSRLGSAAFQEGNPFPFIAAVDNMNRTGEELVSVSRDGDVWLQRNRREPTGEDAMSRKLRVDGWKMVDQMGALREYSRGNERLRVLQRMFTTRYLVLRLGFPNSR